MEIAILALGCFWGPEIKFSKLGGVIKTEVGYCGGNNVGIKRAKGKFIVILNPDTIVEENWLDEMLDAFNEFGDGLFQPKIISLNEPGIIQSSGNMIHAFGFGFAQLIFLYIIIKTIKVGNKATDQVWEGAEGLEWTLSSPHPYHSFNNPPVIK